VSQGSSAAPAVTSPSRATVSFAPRAKPSSVDPMNEALLKMDYRKLESQEAKDGADAKMKEKALAATTRVPEKAQGLAPVVDPTTVTPLQARLIERKMQQEAGRTVPKFVPKGAGVPLIPGATSSVGLVAAPGPVGAGIGGGSAGPGPTIATSAPVFGDAVSHDVKVLYKASLMPVHPTDPVPTCLELEPRKMMLVDTIIIRVCYTHAQFGFRNEMISIPATKVSLHNEWQRRHCATASASAFPNFSALPILLASCRWTVSSPLVDGRAAGRHRAPSRGPRGAQVCVHTKQSRA
jgi:hypothetical protein